MKTVDLFERCIFNFWNSKQVEQTEFAWSLSNSHWKYLQSIKLHQVVFGNNTYCSILLSDPPAKAVVFLEAKEADTWKRLIRPGFQSEATITQWHTERYVKLCTVIIFTLGLWSNEPNGYRQIKGTPLVQWVKNNLTKRGIKQSQTM